MSRSVALVGALHGPRFETHTHGYPMDPAKMLPMADVLLLITGNDGAMLFRYTAHGELAGDTWHETVGDACEQAAAEYGYSLGEWVDVPYEVENPHEYAVRYAAERLDTRGDW